MLRSVYGMNRPRGDFAWPLRPHFDLHVPLCSRFLAALVDPQRESESLEAIRKKEAAQASDLFEQRQRLLEGASSPTPNSTHRCDNDDNRLPYVVRMLAEKERLHARDLELRRRTELEQR